MLQWHSNPWLLQHWRKCSKTELNITRSWSTARELLSRHLKNDNIHQMYVHVSTCWHPRLWKYYPWNRKQGSPHTSATSSPTRHGCGQWRSEHTPLWRNPRSSLSRLRMRWPDERPCEVHVMNGLSWVINVQVHELYKIAHWEACVAMFMKIQATFILSQVWNRSFISTVRPTGHTNPSRKRSSNRKNLKTSAFRFSVDGKHFENGVFWKRWRHDNQVIFLTELSYNTLIQSDRRLSRL